MAYWKKYPEIYNELLAVESYMKKQVISRKPVLTEICLDLIEAGGKRIRPAFLILAAKQGKYDSDKIIPLASSIELLHTATLVHDDIIDESVLRRGRPTVHEKWGKDMAIYVGDFLFTKTFLMLSGKNTIKYLDKVATAVKVICEGEVDQYEIKYNRNTTSYDYLKRIYRKTALIFSMSLIIGAQQSKCNKKTIKALGKFGILYGLIFQIQDDLLDYISEEEKIGKPIGNDIQQGVYTLPLLLALEQSHLNREIIPLLDKKENIKKEDIETITRLVKESNALEETKEFIVKMYNKALEEIEVLKDSPYKEIYIDLLKNLVN